MENNYLCYQVKVDESIMPLSLIEYMENDYIDAAVSHSKTATNHEEKLVFEYLKANGIGMKYIFGSDTSLENVIIAIAPEKLK